MTRHANVSILQAHTSQHFDDIRTLFRAYGAFLATSPSGAPGISIDGFEQEITGLPGRYAPPDGVLLIAQAGGQTAGCLAMRLIHSIPTERSCEMKRLWVGSAFRGLGLGGKLVEAAITWAQSAHYQAIYLDTAPAAMPAANKLYQDFGFEQIDRYNDNPVPGIVFFRLGLASLQTL